MGVDPGSGSGKYVMSGGSLAVPGDEHIGKAGAGTFIQSAGTHSVGGTLYIGSVGGSGNLVTVGRATNTKWEGNIVWGGSRGDMPADGGRSVNPALAVDSGGLDRLTAGSPAIDAATGSYAQVTKDMDLRARSGAKDVGADEYVAGGTNRRPLTPSDVGPTAP